MRNFASRNYSARLRAVATTAEYTDVSYAFSDQIKSDISPRAAE